jgi:S-disulfanyl-L-cysteine oxidoreductase SoxD
MHSRAPSVCAAAAAIGVAAVFIAREDAAGQDGTRLNLGRPVSESHLRPWNLDIRPDGTGLPQGEGAVVQGKSIYERKCIACHGADGNGQPMERLVGGRGTLTSDDPVKTMGSYWPYATTVFDYMRRAMPLDKPQSLTANEVYALTAYLLHLNGIVGPDAVMNAQSLPKVRMPNQRSFRGDPRPDVSNTACLSDCR